MLRPQSVALVLAYIHSRSCRFLPGGCLAAVHLRTLAAWIGYPSPQLRSIRAHPILAAHLALLQAAGLLTHASGYWMSTPAAFDWLEADRGAQREMLRQPFYEPSLWEAALSDLHLQETLSIDYAAYVQQTLARWSADENVPEIQERATWMPASSPEEWRLRLPAGLGPALIFHLLQLGEWGLDESLRCTSLTLARVAQRGYTRARVKDLLIIATGQPLPAEREAQLAAWYGRLDAYQLRAVYLLSTKRPEQMAELGRNRRLRPYLVEQLSPRHAIISPDMAEPLRRWLGRSGFWLGDDGQATEGEGEEMGDAAGYTWLAWRVMAGLAEWMPLPVSLPASGLVQLEARLEARQKTLLEQKARDILEGLRGLIIGWDAFFPAERPANPAWIALMERAMAEGECLDITYQAPGEREPRYRRVEPLRLERLGELVYLYAYCYRAEKNLYFRLDRVHSCNKVTG